MARRLVDVFEGHSYVVTPSASCACMVIHHAPKLLAADRVYAERSKALAQRTWEFGRFLTEVLQVDVSSISRLGLPPTTFHCSCHYRELQAGETASRLARELGGAHHRPLEDVDQCCGFGGAFSALYPGISHAMAADKVAAIGRSGARVVISNEAGCTMTLEGTARRQGLNVRFAHVAEVVAEGLGLMDDWP
jgi:L-lactate dehydrogenase complex protein LldE